MTTLFVLGWIEVNKFVGDSDPHIPSLHVNRTTVISMEEWTCLQLDISRTQVLLSAPIENTSYIAL